MTKLDDVLSQFSGKKPDEIAEIVKRRGIKGRMGTTYGCPMALLLHGITTGDFVIGRKYIARRSGNNIDRAITPKNIADFIRKFDIGGYPELVAPPPRCLAPRAAAPRPRGKRGTRTRPPIKNHLAKLVGRFNERKSP